METELSFGQTTFLLWVPPFLSYELWKLRIELWKHLVQTGSYVHNPKEEYSFPFFHSFIVWVKIFFKNEIFC